MKPLLSTLAAISLFISLSASAQQASVTATCKDGTAFSGKSRSGACGGHGGVQTWGAPAPAVTTAPPTTTAAPAPASTTAPASAAAAAGAPGTVWVNAASKVYHCPGDRWYGKTKAGEYTTEAKAKAAGDRPDHGKACSP
jgi:hypothetical protein